MKYKSVRRRVLHPRSLVVLACYRVFYTLALWRYNIPSEMHRALHPCTTNQGDSHKRTSFEHVIQGKPEGPRHNATGLDHK
ncbi:hypothetical protein F5888DRAFT_1751705 [Russula emetica]|nr:hypothetical protein F5888DRAFT_1751705 [Russula emetica]